MFRASSVPIIRSFYCTFGTDKFDAGLMTVFKQSQDDPAWKLSSNLQGIYQCRMDSKKLLMMGKGNARNMYSFLTK